MKVLIVGPSPTKSKGGMATVISNQLTDKELNSKYDISMHSSFVDGNKIWRIVYSIFAYLFFLRKRKKYDLFHIHVASYGSTFRKRRYLNTIKKAKKKVVVHIHGAEYLVFYSKLNAKRQKQVKDFLNRADMVIALSDDWKDKFEKTFGINNCYSLNNGIDTDKYENAVSDMEEHKNTFLAMGRLGERKGTYDLLDAIGIAVKENPNIKLFLAGDGEIEKVTDLISSKKLQSNIKVVGWIDFNKKIELLKESSTVVLPSYNEGLPMAILEGMAAGKAIISSTVGAIPEVVKEQNGILIEAGDINALGKALIKCSTDTDMIKQMSKNNIDKIKQEFSMRNMHKKLDEYYQLVSKEK